MPRKQIGPYKWFTGHCHCRGVERNLEIIYYKYKKLCYRRRAAIRAMAIKIMQTAAQLWEQWNAGSENNGPTSRMWNCRMRKRRTWKSRLFIKSTCDLKPYQSTDSPNNMEHRHKMCLNVLANFRCQLLNRGIETHKKICQSSPLQHHHQATAYIIIIVIIIIKIYLDQAAWTLHTYTHSLHIINNRPTQ